MSQPDSPSTDAFLTPLEARIIGCLMEKQRTTPDQYPLTLNAMVNACNQKSARSPVMHLTQGEVAHTLGVLRDRGLVHASLGGRTERYDHKMVGTFFLSREEQALLCVLMLRGPQTLGELRVNASRMAELPDLGAVRETLQKMAERDHRLIVELPRLPGKREERYAHLLCGREALEVHEVPAAPGGPNPGTAYDEARIAALEGEVAALRADLDRLWRLTGMQSERGEAN